MNIDRIKLMTMMIFVCSCVLFAQQTFWNQLNISLNEYIYAMTVTPKGKIFIGTSKGVYCSVDTGKTWTPKKSGLPVNPSVGTITSDAEGNVYAGIYSSGVYRLINNDTTWIEMNSGLTKKNISFVAVHPVKQIVYAGTYNSGSFFMKKSDTSWIAMDSSLSDPHIGCFLIDTLNKHLFAGTWSGVFRSSNEGMNWERMGSTTTFVITTMAVNSKGYIFAGSSNYGIFRSTDNGMNWVPKNTQMFDSLVSNLIVNPKDVIYTSTSMGVFYSTNDGNSWVPISGVSGRTSYLTIDAKNFLYAGTQAGKVYRSKVSTTTGLTVRSHQELNTFELYQNYPNPFNPSTIISYSLPHTVNVILTVFDALGRVVTTLVDDEKSRGSYEVKFNGSNLSSGVYFYRLQAGNYSVTKKLSFLK